MQFWCENPCLALHTCAAQLYRTPLHVSVCLFTLAGYPASLGSLPPCLPTYLPTSLPPSHLPLPFSLPFSLTTSFPSGPHFIPPIRPSLSPSLPPYNLPITSSLPLSILRVPDFAQNICVIAQDTCIPEIRFKTWCFKLLWNFDRCMYRFVDSLWNFPDFWIFYP